MRPNYIKRAWKDGKQTVGGWIGTDAVHTAETMARVGFDWLCICLLYTSPSPRD